MLSLRGNIVIERMARLGIIGNLESAASQALSSGALSEAIA
jgi:hypothetical protein